MASIEQLKISLETTFHSHYAYRINFYIYLLQETQNLQGTKCKNPDLRKYLTEGQGLTLHIIHGLRKGVLIHYFLSH